MFRRVFFWTLRWEYIVDFCIYFGRGGWAVIFASREIYFMGIFKGFVLRDSIGSLNVVREGVGLVISLVFIGCWFLV